VETILPPEFEPLLAALGAERLEVRAMFRNALVLMMIDDEKAFQLGSRVEDGHENVRVRTVAGDEFEIEPPNLSEEKDRLLLHQIRGIVADDELDETES